MRPRHLTLILAVLLTIGFGYGLYRLFDLRFEQGDVYPPYSSLRSDPLGTRVLFEALQRIEGRRVERHFQRMDRVAAEDPTTILVTGVGPELLMFGGMGMANATLDLVRAGHRVVVSFRPIQKELPGMVVSTPESDNSTDRTAFVPAGQTWKVLPGNATLDLGNGLTKRAARVGGESFLPENLPMHTLLTFAPEGAGWRTIYTVGPSSVLLERREGNGTLVLLADAYLLSNEAMRRDRQVELLAWLVGHSNAIVFHEEALGVIHTSGVMSLIKRYRLQGGLVGLLAAALLFFWRQSVPFVPVRHDVLFDAQGMATKSVFSGLVSLLKRGIDAHLLVKVCMGEWRKSGAQVSGVSPEAVERAEAYVDRATMEGGEDPAATYNNVIKLLARR